MRPCAAQPGQAVDQLRAGSLELLDADDPADRLRGLDPGRGRGVRVVPGVRGELGLKPADLLAQGAPQSRIPELGVELGEGVGRQLGRFVGRRRRVDRRRQLARVDAGLTGVGDRRRGDSAELAQFARRLRHIRAATVLGGDQPVVLETPVDGTRGVDVDPGEPRELADARQPVARTQRPAGDHAPELPGELRPDRDLALALDPEVDEPGAGHLLGGDRELGKSGPAGRL